MQGADDGEDAKAKGGDGGGAAPAAAGGGGDGGGDAAPAGNSFLVALCHCQDRAEKERWYGHLCPPSSQIPPSLFSKVPTPLRKC